VLDLGAGHGTVTLLLSRVLPDANFHLVEAQEVSAELAQRNLDENQLTSRATVACCDLREVDLRDRYDLVTGTPPFMPKGSGILPRDAQRAAARFELRGGIEEYLACASRALAPGGRVSMLMDAAQDERVRRGFRAAGLRLRRVLVVHPRTGRSPRFRGYVDRKSVV
jgi:tRNA1(Val) A37 N6-methylase TrmN6